MIIEGNFINYDFDFYGQILVNEKGEIEKFAKKITDRADKVFLDHQIIFPCIGDIHIHAREDSTQKLSYKENFSTASAAARNGGLTYVVDMPNTPNPATDEKTYLAKMEQAKGYKTDFYFYAGIGPGTSPFSFDVPYKAFMGPSIGELFFKDIQSLENTLEKYRGKSISFHCEDPYILEKSVSEKSHLERRPREASNVAIVYAIYLIKKYNLRGKICHLPTGDSLDLIRKARQQGINVTLEVTPQHLYWGIEEMLVTSLPWLQMNPPIRTVKDKEELIEAFKNGDIDYLATDHAPHRICEKLKNFLPNELQKELRNIISLSENEIQRLNNIALENYNILKELMDKRLTTKANQNGTSGTPQLDSYGLFMMHLLNNKNVSVNTLSRNCCYNPGNFINQFERLTGGKKYGLVREGYQGKFTVFDTTTQTTLTNDMVKSRSAWTPFDGVTFPGSIVEVI